jgi:hypothetical protein
VAVGAPVAVGVQGVDALAQQLALEVLLVDGEDGPGHGGVLRRDRSVSFRTGRSGVEDGFMRTEMMGIQRLGRTPMSA